MKKEDLDKMVQEHLTVINKQIEYINYHKNKKEAWIEIHNQMKLSDNINVSIMLKAIEQKFEARYIIDLIKKLAIELHEEHQVKVMSKELDLQTRIKTFNR